MQNGVGDAIGLTTEQVNLLAAQGAVRLSRCLPVAGNSWGKLQEVHGGCPKSMVSIENGKSQSKMEKIPIEKWMMTGGTLI